MEKPVCEKHNVGNPTWGNLYIWGGGSSSFHVVNSIIEPNQVNPFFCKNSVNFTNNKYGL